MPTGAVAVAVPQQAVAEDEEQQQSQRQVLTVYQPVEGLEGMGEGTTLEVIVTQDLLAPPEKKAKKEHPLGKAGGLPLTTLSDSLQGHNGCVKCLKSWLVKCVLPDFDRGHGHTSQDVVILFR